MRETWVRSPGWEDPLEKGKATHSSFWPGEFHGLYSPCDRRVRHDWVTFTFFSLSYISKENTCLNIYSVYETHTTYTPSCSAWIRCSLLTLATSCQPSVPNDPKSRELEFQHCSISVFESECADFLSKISPHSPFCRCKKIFLSSVSIFLSWTFFFLFFSILSPPLNWLLIQRSLDLKIPGMIPMAEMGIRSPHQPSGSSGNIFGQHIKATSLYYTYFPKNRNALWFRKYFWALTPSQKHFHPSSKSLLKEHTY